MKEEKIKRKKTEYKTTAAERISYSLYFIGQNLIYALIYMYINVYFTDVGIPAFAVAGIALTVKVWDAVNDPLFGGLVDKVHFKKGKFVPWIKISIPIVLAATMLLFAIPENMGRAAKTAWAVAAYLLWSVGYTMNDVPIFGLVMTMTDNQNERTSLNVIGRVSATLASTIVMVIIPSFRESIGGWTATVFILAAAAAVTMIPICLTAKERMTPAKEEQEVSLGEVLQYLMHNRFLFIYYTALLISGSLNIASPWRLYIARFCLQDESIMSITGIMGVIPTVAAGLFIPALSRRIDKFRLYYTTASAALILNMIRWAAGFENLTVYLILTFAASVPSGFTSVLMFMFTPDCAEYGCYMTGKSCPGITFAAQTFFAKLQSALMTALGAFILGMTGFIEGEDAVQAEGFADVLWNTGCIVPAAGAAASLVILRFYKLNDHDVQLMARCNYGELTREEAESRMIYRY